MLVIPLPDDRLYLAHAEEGVILRERKDLTQNLQDYVDEEITDTITAVGVDPTGAFRTVDVTHTYSEPLSAGWSFTQGTTKSRVTAVASLGSNSYRLTLKNLVMVLVTNCQLGIPVPVKVEWIPEDAGSPSLLKQFTSAQFYQESNTAYSHRAGFFADTRSAFAYAATTTLPSRKGWGSNKWGTAPWGDTGGLRSSTPIEFMVPRDHQICTTLRVLYEHAQAKEKVSIAQMALNYKVLGTKTARRTQ